MTVRYYRSIGEPLEFGAPHRKILGYGTFVRYEPTKAWLAWDFFGDKNGTDTFAEMAARIDALISLATWSTGGALRHVAAKESTPGAPSCFCGAMSGREKLP